MIEGLPFAEDEGAACQFYTSSGRAPLSPSLVEALNQLGVQGWEAFFADRQTGDGERRRVLLKRRVS